MGEIVGRIVRNDAGELELVFEQESVKVVEVHQIAVPAPVAAPNTFYQNVIKARIPCAYGSKSCKGITFAPKGVGSKQHTTCKPAHAAMVAARKGN